MNIYEALLVNEEGSSRVVCVGADRFYLTESIIDTIKNSGETLRNISLADSILLDPGDYRYHTKQYRIVALGVYAGLLVDKHQDALYANYKDNYITLSASKETLHEDVRNLQGKGGAYIYKAALTKHVLYTQYNI